MVSMNYAKAGRAVITVKSNKTGEHKTFKLTKKEYQRDDGELHVAYFVGIRRGEDYKPMGTLIAGEAKPNRITHESITKEDFAGFAWMMRAIEAQDDRGMAEIKHEGHCGRCGRELTDPDSIDLGIGPECAKMMGLVMAVAA